MRNEPALRRTVSYEWAAASYAISFLSWLLRKRVFFWRKEIPDEEIIAIRSSFSLPFGPVLFVSPSVFFSKRKRPLAEKTENR